MTLLEKINKLNEVCDKTLTVTHCNKWQISCFRKGKPLSMDKKYPFIENESFEDLIDEAYEFVFRKEQL